MVALQIALRRNFNPASTGRHQNDRPRLNVACGVIRRVNSFLEKVRWCVLKRVDEPAPWSTATWNNRQREGQRLPIGIDHQVEPASVLKVGSHGEAVRVSRKIWRPQVHSVPLELCSVDEFGERQEISSRIRRKTQPQLDQELNEPVKVGMPLAEAPVEPTHLIILAICVVIAELRPP